MAGAHNELHLGGALSGLLGGMGAAVWMGNSSEMVAWDHHPKEDESKRTWEKRGIREGRFHV